MGEIGTDHRGLVAEAEAGGSGKEEGMVLGDEEEEEETSPVEQVRLTVPSTDDPSLPVWTFRMWSIGLLSCALMSFLNQFFSYRTLPRARFRAPALLGGGEWSLNPGPFNIKEHVLISIFANAGFAFGNGSAYAVAIIDIIRAFYHRHISFFTAWLLVVTTQVATNDPASSIIVLITPIYISASLLSFSPPPYISAS
jgi:hypothetical protein